jgi:hypothetical protein
MDSTDRLRANNFIFVNVYIIIGPPLIWGYFLAFVFYGNGFSVNFKFKAGPAFNEF